MNSPPTASLKEKITDLLAPHLNTFYRLLFLLPHFWDCCGYSEILSSFALFSLMMSPKDLPSLCFWVINPISNPYLHFLCLDTHLCLSLVLSLLKPDKTLSMHWQVSVLHLWRAYKHCAICPNLRWIFILYSLAPLVPSFASHSLKLLYVCSLQFIQIQKNRSLLSFLRAFLIPVLLSWHTEINLLVNCLRQFLFALVFLWPLK